MTDTVDTSVSVVEETRRGMVILTVGGNDEFIPQESLGLTMDSTQGEILEAVRGVREEIATADEYNFVARKAINTQTIYVYPKPEAG